jgi:hypothetical protein
MKENERHINRAEKKELLSACKLVGAFCFKRNITTGCLQKLFYYEIIRKELLMKTMVKRNTLHFICIVIFSLCLFILSGCDEDSGFFIEIQSPADGVSFESGESIQFSMSLKRMADTIPQGTIIQWTSDRDGDFWKEEITQTILPDKGSAEYHQEFSTSVFSGSDHTLTCKAYRLDDSGNTYNLATEQVRIYIKESQNTTTTTATATTTGGGGNLDACTALNDLEVRAGEPQYYGNGAECWASIILKNNGMKAIQGGFYTDDSTINTTDPHEFKRDGWGFLYLDPGQEIEYTIQPSGWGYQPQYDGTTRTVITSKATAVYSEDGCMWILNEDLFSDGVIDAPIRTRDISGLDPCN